MRILPPRRTGWHLAWVIAVCALALADPHAQDGRGIKEEELVLFSVRHDRGASAEYRVSARRLTLTKNWSADSEPPPLSIVSALEIARKRAGLARPEDFILSEIKLRAFPVDDKGGVRWYYEVGYRNAPDVAGDRPPQPRNVVILMDGSIVEPVRTR